MEFFGQPVVQLHQQADVTEFIAALRGRVFDLLIFDTLSLCFIGGDETSNDMTTLVDGADRIRRETHAAILIVHHMPLSGDNPRGHTSLLCNIECGLKVTKVTKGKPEATLRFSKQKDGPDNESIGFRLSKRVKSCAVEVITASPRPEQRSPRIASISDHEVLKPSTRRAFLALAPSTSTIVDSAMWKRDAGFKSPSTFYGAVKDLERLGYVLPLCRRDRSFKLTAEGVMARHALSSNESNSQKDTINQ